jgi:hypothetical protein
MCGVVGSGGFFFFRARRGGKGRTHGRVAEARGTTHQLFVLLSLFLELEIKINLVLATSFQHGILYTTSRDISISKSSSALGHGRDRSAARAVAMALIYSEFQVM